MSIRDQLATDFQTNLTADGDSVKITLADTTEFNVKAQVIRKDMKLDPDTGVLFYEPHSVVTVSLKDLPGATIADTTLIEATDVQGNTIKSYAITPQYNYDLGFVTFVMEDFTE